MNNAYLAKAKQMIPDPQILSVVAAKRARQLAGGGRPMIKCDCNNLLDIALLEIAEGLLSYEFSDENETAEAAEPVEAKQEEAPAEETPSW
ncbi:MAG: DNA-directed RNA polymerase subunit omega [Lentisphaeria bacterium]|nr:DNA-directed RNA polymerase subunit omega [Lentisphaeria bacterium]